MSEYRSIANIVGDVVGALSELVTGDAYSVDRVGAGNTLRFSSGACPLAVGTRILLATSTTQRLTVTAVAGAWCTVAETVSLAPGAVTATAWAVLLYQVLASPYTQISRVIRALGDLVPPAALVTPLPFEYSPAPGPSGLAGWTGRRQPKIAIYLVDTEMDIGTPGALAIWDVREAVEMAFLPAVATPGQPVSIHGVLYGVAGAMPLSPADAQGMQRNLWQISLETIDFRQTNHN